MEHRRGAEILGHDDAQALVGRDWFDLAIPPGKRVETRAVFGKLMAGQIEAAGVYENPIVRSDGTERLIACCATQTLKRSSGRTWSCCGGDPSGRRRARLRRTGARWW